MAHSCSTSDQEKGASRGKWRAEGRAAGKKGARLREGCTDGPAKEWSPPDYSIDEQDDSLGYSSTGGTSCSAPEFCSMEMEEEANIKEANQVNHDPNKWLTQPLCILLLVILRQMNFVIWIPCTTTLRSGISSRIFSEIATLRSKFSMYSYPHICYLTSNEFSLNHDPNKWIMFFCSRKILPGLVPHVGMEFGNSNETWAFWLSYGGQQGFDVRKRCRRTDQFIRIQVQWQSASGCTVILEPI